jgi:DNA-directed RNA polymerase subunit RPC12/RpoP
MKGNCSIVNSDFGLICSECGNTERFIEIMAKEVHLVNGRKDYIRLLEGIADRYLCWRCGATITAATATKK